MAGCVQATCPVCRAVVAYDVETLAAAPPPLDVQQADHFTPSAELRSLQQQMAALYLRQKQRGGIIQAQDNSVLLLTVSPHVFTWGGRFEFGTERDI